MAKTIKDIGAFIPYRNDDVVATAELVQAGETLLGSFSLHNTTAADAFLQLFDAASAGAVTVGTTVADYVIPVGASGIENEPLSVPLYFKNGLVIASTTATDGSSGAAMDVSFGIA